MRTFVAVTASMLFLLGLGLQPEPAVAQSGEKIMVFGGENHDTYLGCLNCSELSSTSINNEMGEFGSPYSNTSAYNPYATDPPVVVDESGDYYGELTTNPYNPDAINPKKLA